MFWLRNKKINFQLDTFIWRPEKVFFFVIFTKICNNPECIAQLFQDMSINELIHFEESQIEFRN